MKKGLIFVFVILCSFTTKGTAQVSRAVFHGCEKRCGNYPVGEYPYFGDVKWKFQTAGKVFSSPVIFKETVYLGSEDHHLYALHTSTGGLKWKFKTAGEVHSSPAYYRETIYFGSLDGHYYAVDAETGKEKWKFKTGGERWMGAKGYLGMKPGDQYLNDPWDFYLSSPVLDVDSTDPSVYFGSSDGHLYALNAETGELRWKFKTDGVIHSSPALYNGKVYIGSWDSNLYALDAKTGEKKWSIQTGTQMGMNGIQASPAIAEGKVFFGARDGHFYALDAETGEQKWKYFADNSWILSTAAIKGGTVYVGTSDSFLFLALDSQSGKEKFRFKTNGYVYSSPALVGNTAFFGDFTGNMFSLDLLSGKVRDVWSTEGRKRFASATLNNEGNMDFKQLVADRDVRQYQTTVEVMDQFYRLGSILSSPAVGEGVMYFGSADGALYALNLKGERPGETSSAQETHH